MGKGASKLFFILFFIFLLQNSLLAETSADVDEEFSSKISQETKLLSKVTNRNKIIDNGNKDNKVIVEPRNIIPVTSAGKMEMVPYRMRRKKWGQLWGVSYGTYVPEDYQDQTPISFSEFYPAPSLGLLSVEATFKRNYDYITLGLYTSVGYFKTESDVINFDSTLMIIPVKLGFVASLETLWQEPWVVPYVNGGIYSSFYQEETNGSTVDGTTLVSFYLTGGLMFQVDWLDDLTAREGYQASGIENTFIFIEGNYLSDSVEEKDPAMNGIYASAGLKVEF